MVLNFSDRDKVCSFVLDMDSSLSKGEGSVTKGINVLVIVDGLIDLGEMGTFAGDVQRWPVYRIPSSNVCGGNFHCSKKEAGYPRQRHFIGNGIIIIFLFEDGKSYQPGPLSQLIDSDGRLSC